MHRILSASYLRLTLVLGSMAICVAFLTTAVVAQDSGASQTDPG